MNKMAMHSCPPKKTLAHETEGKASLDRISAGIHLHSICAVSICMLDSLFDTKTLNLFCLLQIHDETVVKSD